MIDVDQLLRGSVDLHCHSAPSPFPRRFDHAGAARDAESLGMRGILVKSHHHSTVMDVLAMAPQLDGITTRVFGGVALNSQVGGINPSATQMAIRMGGRAVWFPTFSSRRHIESHPETDGFPTSTVHLDSTPVDVLDAQGCLIPSVYEVLDEIAAGDVLLSAGHMHPAEAALVFDAASQRGIRRMVLSHPDFIIGATVDDCHAFVERGAFIEHEFGMYDPEGYRKWPPAKLLEWIREMGAENTVLASDLGQAGRPSPVEALRRVAQALLDLGLTPDELQLITVHNPGFLLGLDTERPVSHVASQPAARATGA